MRYSYFKYQVIFFSLLNILTSFKSYIHKHFTNKLYIFIIIYLDNILFHIENANEKYINTIK